MNNFRLYRNFAIPYVSIIDQAAIWIHQDSNSLFIFIISNFCIHIFHFGSKTLHAHALPAAATEPIDGDCSWFGDRLQFGFITG